MQLAGEGRATLGQQIRGLRRRRGWTQEQLEEASGVGQSTISALENGRQDQTSIEYLRRLAGAFEVSVNLLLQAAGLMEAAGDEPPPAAVQLPLSDPDEQFDPAAIVAYVESRPGIRFQERLRARRERLPVEAYTRFCVALFRAWSSNAHLALDAAEMSEQPR